MAERGPAGFLWELKRRRVLRVAGAYVTAAFCVLQGADYICRALLAPDWAFRVVVGLTVLGLVLAIALSWVYDVAPDGLRRTPAGDVGDEPVPAALPARGRPASARGRGPRRGLWVTAAVSIAGLAAAAAGWAMVRQRGAGLHANRVVVAPFRNLTGEPALDPLGEMAADWITQGLSESGVVEVADGSTALALAQGSPSVANLRDLVETFARRTGSRLVVAGRFYREADSLAFVAQVVNAESGRLVRAIGPVYAPRTAPAAGAERLRERLVAELAVLLDERLAQYEPLETRPPTFDAYREYIEGVRANLADRFPDADRHFSRAYALDTTFYRALIGATSAALFSNPPRFDTLLAQADRIRDRLSPADQAQLDWQHAYRSFDGHAMYAASGRFAQAEPGSDLAIWSYALDAGRVHRYRESLRLLRRLDPDRLLSRWKYYWAYIAGAQHALGDFQGELATADEQERRAPESALGHALRLSALTALGRTGEVRTLATSLAERLATDVDGRDDLRAAESLGYQLPASNTPFLFAARELVAHGRAADGRALAAEGARWSAARSAEERDDSMFRLVWSLLLQLAGRPQDADALLAATPRRGGIGVFLDWARSLALAAQGDRQAAVEMQRTVSFGDARLDRYRRATFAAALGEREEALRYLREYTAGGGLYGDWWVHSEPLLQPYLGDPGVQRLLQD